MKSLPIILGLLNLSSAAELALADSAQPAARERRLVNWRCVDTALNPTKELRSYDGDYDEYICPEVDPDETQSWNPDHYRFGIYDGRAVLLNPDGEEIWGSPDNLTPGTTLRMYQGGKVVLLDKNGKYVWAMKHMCKAPQSRLEIRKTGVFMVGANKKVKWYIGFDGKMSGCNPDPSTFPPDPCVEVTRDKDYLSCQYLALQVETQNYEQAILEVKKLPNGKFKVTDLQKFCWFCENDDWSSLKPTSFTLSFSKSGALLVNGKKSYLSCWDIAHGGYKISEGTAYYWDWFEVSYECTTFGMNLLKAMLNFYEEDEYWACVSDC